MAIPTPHEIRDPIHGLIQLTSQELRIVNTPTFQRLRRIRQLALADVVYPGAHHTRFEHSIGTLHVAHRILTRLAELEHSFDNGVVETVRLAALLHDIGHGPFSHVSEELLDRFYDRDKVGESTAREKIHEKITVDIITKLPEISDVLDDAQREAVVSIIRGTGERSFQRDIVSSSLDADKMDYLLRDARYAGVKYGEFDIDKVIESCRIARSGSESFLAIDESGIFAVEQLVLSKHHMTQQVYAHRVRTITDVMIVRGLELAIKASPELRSLYAYDGSPEHLQRYVEADDATVAATVRDSGDPVARDIFDRLRNRRLFKELAVVRLDGSEITDHVLENRVRTLSAESCRALEAEVARLIECDPAEVIVYRKSVKNPVYYSPGTLDPEAILVKTRKGELKSPLSFPDLTVGKLPAAERLHVVGRFDYATSVKTEEDRAARTDLEQRIRRLILDYVRVGP